MLLITYDNEFFAFSSLVSPIIFGIELSFVKNILGLTGILNSEFLIGLAGYLIFDLGLLLFQYFSNSSSIILV